MNSDAPLYQRDPEAWHAQREFTEELRVGELLCVHWVSPHGPCDDLLAFIFDGGELSNEQIAGLTLIDGELAAFEFCIEDQ